MEVAVRFEKAVMDGRNQGWTILNKFYKTGILSKAVLRFWFVWLHGANSLFRCWLSHCLSRISPPIK